jgi:hypothetical protein
VGILTLKALGLKELRDIFKVSTDEAKQANTSNLEKRGKSAS